MADVSVRPARLGDVPAMSDVQAQVWTASPGLPGGRSSAPDPVEISRAWERAIMVPPSSRHSVWVATAQDNVVGLAALAPTSDPDLEPDNSSEILLLAVEPTSRKRGHGSRLLAALIQHLTDAGEVLAITWVVGSDDESRSFLEGAGWAPDGAHRTLAQHEDDPPEQRLGQIRMATDLTPDPDDP